MAVCTRHEAAKRPSFFNFPGYGVVEREKLEIYRKVMYEEDISAEQQEEKDETRISQQNEDQSRKEDDRPQALQGPCEAFGQQREVDEG